MPATLSSAKGWNIAQILADGHKHILGEAIISVPGLEGGSKIRRTGHKGMLKWATVWKTTQKGFDLHEAFIRVYVDAGAGLDKLQMLSAAAKAKSIQAGIRIPVTGVHLGTLVTAEVFKVVCVIDGMHRTLTLQDAVASWKLENPDEAVESCPFYWIRAVFYHPDVKQMMAVLAKASNDQKQVHVQEDIFERMTITNQVISGYEEFVSKGEAYTQATMARHYMKQIGCPMNATAVNYHSQLCQMATTLKPVQGWLTEKLNSLEERGGARAEVTFVVFLFFLLLGMAWWHPESGPFFSTEKL